MLFTTQDCGASRGFSHFLPCQPCPVGIDSSCVAGVRTDAQGPAARKRGQDTARSRLFPS